MLFCAGEVYRTADGMGRFGLLSSFGGVPILSDNADDLFREVGHLGHVYALAADLRSARLVRLCAAPQGQGTRVLHLVRFSLAQHQSLRRAASREPALASGG
jgi:hypothetical protein